MEKLPLGGLVRWRSDTTSDQLATCSCCRLEAEGRRELHHLCGRGRRVAGVETTPPQAFTSGPKRADVSDDLERPPAQ